MMVEALHYEFAGVPGAGQIQLGVGYGAIAWTPPFSIADVEQLLVQITTTIGPVQTLFMRMRFATDYNTSSATGFSEECVEAAGLIVAGAQQYTVYHKEWGPFVADTVTIERPVSAHLCAIGWYASGAVGNLDTVSLNVERQRSGQLLQGG